MQYRLRLLLALVILSYAADNGVAQPDTSAHRDDKKIGVQAICPVSGKPLGSMGKPVKVKVGDEELFLCCRGCARGQIDKQHWVTIHENFARAQGKCPVMDKSLPARPKWTFIDGQIVYVCCPPCTRKIEKEPAKFLNKVAEYYAASLDSIVR